MKYLAAIMARGHSIEYFIEGGRSRTGRLLQPKTGMLSMTVRSFLRDPLRPVVFLPVYFGYDRILEGATYIGELSGKPKEKESVFGLIRSLRKLRERFGRVHVNLGEPIALAELLDRYDSEWRTQPVADDTRIAWIGSAVDELAATIMRNINAAAAVSLSFVGDGKRSVRVGATMVSQSSSRPTSVARSRRRRSRSRPRRFRFAATGGSANATTES